MLSIDKAISHCLEVAEQEEQLSKTGKWFEGEDWNVKAREHYAKCAAEHRQIAEWLTELKEAKRLLKLAVEDYPDLTDMWRYADKFMKLIGGD